MRGRGVEVLRIALTAALLPLASVAGAVDAGNRSAIAIFRDWGAFRDGPAGAPLRCYAIAEPPSGAASAGRAAFASVASWPAKRIRAQLAIHLSRAARSATPVTLNIGDLAFALVARGTDAWAHDRREDAVIVGAMRSGSSMSVSGVDADGHPFADAYRLRGAASAIDAAGLACPIT
jgi:hypothetical protein